jgi:3-hydroxyacyl-CoA dehydrogenase/enoyl-CoA hydratase/3-hydroxybutyryl-CoA epimerase
MTTAAERAAPVQSALHVDVRDGVAIVTFDLPGEPVNKFTASVIDEFTALLTRFDVDQDIRAAVLFSGKDDVWIAGADIEAFLAWRTAEQAAQTSRRAQALLDRVERGRVPLVCAIHGACLGGGLELALASRHRIASEHPKTVLGLPETQLGIIPGIGGTQRLPRTVGLVAALDMILTARNVRARSALRMGLVDELVHPAILRDVALQRAQELAVARRPRERPPRKRTIVAKILEGNPVGRTVVLRRARRTTLRKSGGHYPALMAALDAVAAGYHGVRDDGLAEEARLFGEMAMTPVAKELIFLFFATTALRKDTGVDGAATARDVDRIGVLGTGFMGAGIAAVAARQLVSVRFKDAKHEAVLKGLASVRRILHDPLTKKRITRQQFEDQLSLVSGTVAYDGFARVDLVVEAVFEDLATKHSVLRDVEQVIPFHAIFATNTSTIPIAQIAAASTHPERVIGMHFFSPVERMPLVEVIVAPATAADTVATTVAFGRKLGKTVIVVRDSPGFYVNRMLAPYVNEAGRLLDEGVAIDVVDGALVDFGFPVGPITLIDEVGLDIAGKSGALMYAALGERLHPAKSLSAVLEAGRFGRKGGKGFYHYDERGRKGDVDDTVYSLLPTRKRRTAMSRATIQRRCVFAMVNEAVRCLEDGVLQSPRDGDVGAVFGIGFPPFRGGPFRYIDALGAPQVVDQLRRLDAEHPGRYTPAGVLVEMAQSGRRFYPAEGMPVE